MFDDHALHRARSHPGVTLLFVRHGQTEWNATNRHLGWADIGLDETGRAQALQVAAELGGRFDRVISSPLSRAYDTARALVQSPEVEPGLKELDQGDLDGLDYRTAYGKWPEFYEAFQRDPSTPVPPGSSESLGQCRDRVMAVVDTVRRTSQPGQVVALVSHQMAMASALCTMQGSPLREWRSFRLPNCGIRVVEIHGSTYRIT